MTRSPSPDSPLVNEIDPELRATFPTGRTMEDRPDYIQCRHCKKPMLKTVAASHIKLCEQKKKERARKKKEAKEAAQRAKEAKEKLDDKNGAGDVPTEDSVTNRNNKDEGSERGGGTAGETIIKSAKKSAPKATGSEAPKKSKKRKADGEGDKEPKKKKAKKDEPPKTKVPKPKGPVDVEKQCGVVLPNGGFCARSLTCKSHSMGAKRAVPGRSLPYDNLLAQYQKKNQAKQQSKPFPHLQTKPPPPPQIQTDHLQKTTEAAMDANAPLPDDYLDPSGPIDSDEEKESVMAAVARSRPRPLEQHVFVPVKRKYMYVRMKEMLGNALGGSRGGGGLFANANAREGTAEERRASAGEGSSGGRAGPGLGQAQGRKTSVGGPAASTAV